MARTVHVHFLPNECGSHDLSGTTAVIIDVLRASSTIATALRNGAVCVHPCATVDEARQGASSAPVEAPLLGGERGGIRISGFDLGNSPADYTPHQVNGRRVIFTTTNGTRALLSARTAGTILIGSFVNLDAVAQSLISSNTPVHLVCAGTDGVVTGEDVLFAGCLLWHLNRATSVENSGPTGIELTDAARIALNYWDIQVMLNLDAPHTHPDDAETLRKAFSHQVARVLRTTQGGRNLLELGYDSDIEICSQLDSVNVLPIYSSQQNEIRIRGDS